jgi:hypothetical protein
MIIKRIRGREKQNHKTTVTRYSLRPDKYKLEDREKERRRTIERPNRQDQTPTLTEKYAASGPPSRWERTTY